MGKLDPAGRAWLKGFHIFFIAVWVGSGVCLMFLNAIARPTDGQALHGVLTALKLVDDWVLIPAAIGSLLTGLLISWLTPWGFFKWRWVTVKWVLTVAIALFGTFFMGPWLNQMEVIAATQPLSAVSDPVLLGNRRLLLASAGPMLFALLFMIFISVLKPWKPRRQPGGPGRG